MKIAFFAACLSLIAFLAAYNACATNDCPINRVIGQVASLTKTSANDEAILIREGKSTPLDGRECLFFGDRIETRNNAQVAINTVKEHIVIGQGQSSSSWSTSDKQEKKGDLDEEPLIIKMWTLLTNAQAFPRPVLARGAESRCEGESFSSLPIAPLRQLPTGKQRIGSDLTELIAAWKSGTGFDNVQVRLIRRDGTVVFSKKACGQSWRAVQLPGGGFKPGEGLVLEATDAKGGKLSWDIEVVSPENMPTPKRPPTSQSQLGVWRFFAADASSRLDAVSRLTINDSALAAPKWIFNAALSDTGFEEVK